MKTFKKILYLTGVLTMICACTSQPAPTIKMSPEENSKLFAEQVTRLNLILPQLRNGDDVIISETGISKLLDAVALGAAGETQAQIHRFIGDKQMPLGNDSLYKNINLMYFANKKLIHKSYLKALSDFVIESSVKSINKKVIKLTDGMILNAMENVPPNASVVLSNVMSFNAEWQSPFNKKLTKDKAFSASCKGISKVVQTATMHDFLATHYFEANDIRAVTVPFVNNYHLLIAMTTDKKTSSAKASEWLFGREGKNIHRLMTAPEQKVKLALPKLNLSSNHNLIPVMMRLGVTDLFSKLDANLSNLSVEKLFVSLFEQKVKLKADEKGAKAAAVTTISMLPIAMPPKPPSKPKVFDVNSPFAFAIIKGGNLHRMVLAGEVNSLGLCQQ